MSAFLLTLQTTSMAAMSMFISTYQMTGIKSSILLGHIQLEQHNIVERMLHKLRKLHKLRELHKPHELLNNLNLLKPQLVLVPSIIGFLSINQQWALLLLFTSNSNKMAIEKTCMVILEDIPRSTLIKAIQVIKIPMNLMAIWLTDNIPNHIITIIRHTIKLMDINNNTMDMGISNNTMNMDKRIHINTVADLILSMIYLTLLIATIPISNIGNTIYRNITLINMALMVINIQMKSTTRTNNMTMENMVCLTIMKTILTMEMICTMRLPMIQKMVAAMHLIRQCITTVSTMLPRRSKRKRIRDQEHRSPNNLRKNPKKKLTVSTTLCMKIHITISKVMRCHITIVIHRRHQEVSTDIILSLMLQNGIGTPSAAAAVRIITLT